jgi:hypothetical protein
MCLHPLSLPNDLAPVALQHALADEIRAGRIVWTRIDGLTAADPIRHAALQVALRRIGLHGENGSQAPEVVVLDWCQLAAITADGLAFAAVLCQALRQRGIEVHCLPAEDPAVAAALASPACDVLREQGVTWRRGPSRMITASAPC